MNNIIERTYQDFSEIIKKSTQIVIVGHQNPDGDCLGSTTGLKMYIKENYRDKKVDIILPNHFPEYLKFLDLENEVIVFENNEDIVKTLFNKADLLICMDLNKPSRTDSLEEFVNNYKGYKILIDHHIEPAHFTDLIISSVNTSSTCELTYWLLKKISDKQLTENILKPLFTGLITDTNNFSNSVFPSTFLMASEIIDTGLETEEIQSNVWSSYSQDRMRLMGEMLLNKMIIFNDLGASIMILDKETQDRFNFNKGDSEGFVNLPLNIRGVKISALITEDKDYFRVSLRSKKNISVNDLSKQYFNGGGHERAAGGRLFIPINEILPYFENSVRAFLKNNGTAFER